MRAAARAVLLLGAAGLVLLLFRGAPRDVVLVYGLGERPIAALHVEIARGGGEVLRRAELRPGSGPAGSVRHPVRLPDGEYVLRLAITPAGGPPARLERSITVSESTTIVLPLESVR